MSLNLSSKSLKVSFDTDNFDVLSIYNRDRDEKIDIKPIRTFNVEFETETLRDSDCKKTLIVATDHFLKVKYEGKDYDVIVTYTLPPSFHFLQKRLLLLPKHRHSYLIRRIDLQTFSLPPGSGKLIPFQHGQCRTYFLRKKSSGFMFGIQVPVLDEEQKNLERMVLGYPVNYKFLPGETYQAEILFWGTYILAGVFAPKVPRKVKECWQSAKQPDYGESEAMLKMVQAQWKTRVDRPIVCLNGCQNNTTLAPFDRAHKKSLARDKQLLLKARKMLGEFIFHPYPTWAGAHQAVYRLKSVDRRLPAMPERTAFFKWCRSRGIQIGMYVSLKGAQPWKFTRKEFLPGYCFDRPEWLGRYRKIIYNCPVNRPFMKWLSRVLLEDVSGLNPAQFAQDESDPQPRYTLTCQANNHDHLPGNVSYGYFLVRRRLFQKMHVKFPDIMLKAERPQMDTGIWDALYLDSLFTLSEILDKVTSDEIRRRSRIRHYYHFVPPAMDEVAVKHLARENTDYLMLSILAVSRNYVFCDLPRDWPDARLARVKYWLDWARRRPELMQNCVFLPDWPGMGKCDGYFRPGKDGGYAFFFNANSRPALARLPLNESVGLKTGSRYAIFAEYLSAPLKVFRNRKRITADSEFWFEMPAGSAALLKVSLCR